MKTIYFNLIFFLSAGLLFSCKKDWLDANSDKKLVIPTTIKDLQGMLDNQSVFNNFHPGIGEIGSADYYSQLDVWQKLSIEEQNVYKWASDIYQGAPERGNWSRLYQIIFYANGALEGVEKIDSNTVDLNAWKNIKGSALFFRSLAFFHLAQLYAKPYDAATAATDLGIPLKLSADINEKIARGNVQQAYTQIIADLEKAIALLPATSLYNTRPSKPAAYALLANTYLVMGDYDKALLNADACLQLRSTLLDYNSLTVTASNFPVVLQSNNEILFYSRVFNLISFIPPRAIVDTTFYKMYAADDLRRTVFFKNSAGKRVFFGSYTQSRVLFGGLATDEMYLVKAECIARKGSASEAMNVLNALLEKRWKTGTFTPLDATDAEDALAKILVERRKELTYRTIRWWDLRRLNKDPRFAVTLTRDLGGQIFTLPPNDPRYVLPIPVVEIQISGIEQNQR